MTPTCDPAAVDAPSRSRDRITSSAQRMAMEFACTTRWSRWHSCWVGWTCLLLLAACNRGTPNTAAPVGHAASDGRSPFSLSPATSKPLPPSQLAPAASHARMIHQLQIIRESTNDTISWLGNKDLLGKRQEIERFQSTSGPASRGGASQGGYSLWRDLARLELRLGNEQEAIESLQQALEMLPPDDSASSVGNPETELRFQLGVAYLRLGETQNCCNRHTPESCILPIQGEGIHTNPQGSREALRNFSFVLEHAPRNSLLWLRAVWLTNIAHMTLGEYPEQVPDAWRLPRERLLASGEFPAFTNVAQEAGVDTFSLSGGVVADDMDGDGDIDLIVSSMETDERGQLRLFINDGDANFTERTQEAGLQGLYGGLNLTHADFNEDGHLDILVLRGGWLQSGGRHPNSLLQNNGDGTFTDVTYAAGIAGHGAGAPTQTADWADYDRDGDLDLYIGNEHTTTMFAPSELYRNNGDGTFSNVSKAAGVENLRFAKAVCWGDIDGDRFPELYVSNFGEKNRLYKNNRDGTFSDIAEHLHVDGPVRSFPAWFWDYNNDGRLDLFVAGYADDIAYAAAEAMGIEHDAPLPHLYRADEKGTFQNVAQEAGLATPVSPMGANYGDLDNDGQLDFYLGTGEPEYHNLMPNRMYHNLGDRFEDVTIAGRFGHLQKGHAVVFADLDNDGDLDVFQQLGGAYPGDRYYDAFFKNPLKHSRYLAVRMIGTESARSAIGAKLTLSYEIEGKTRATTRHVDSGGSFGANPFQTWFGLANADRILRLDVVWPTGQRQTVMAPPMDSTVCVVEDRPPTR